MQHTTDRRSFLKTAGVLAVGAGLPSVFGVDAFAGRVAGGAPHAEKLGWRLGCQAYSFNRFTFAEAVDKVASLGLHYIEAYPRQKLSKQRSGVVLNESMARKDRKEVKRLLKDAGIKLVNFGVTRLSANEEADRKTFDFAKDMGIETIVSEPPADAFDLLDKLCDEYDMNVAIHNHPKPSTYWNPDTVLKVCQGHSRRIGSCADTGHWMRSGLNPLEQIKKLEGRIISFHFKDLNRYGKGAHDVPWGTGAADVQALLTEIHRQKIQAVFSIEYEYNWLESLPEIAQCVAYFDKVAAKLA